MNTNEIIDQIKSGGRSRREMLKALGAVGIGVATMPLATMPAQAASEQATYFTWGGYDDESFFGMYAQQNGAMPNMTTFGDAEEAFTKLKAGFTVDIVHPCSGDVPRWRESGLFQPIDTNRIKDFSSIYSRLRSLPGLRDDRGQWFVPFEWGATSITYRTDLVDLQGEEESWGMLFDPRYKGRVAVIDSAADTWYAIAIYAGVDINKPLTDGDFEKTNALLEKLRDNVRIYTNDMTSLDQSLKSGEVVMAITWNENPVRLLGDGVPVKFATPKEGALTWTCGHMLLANAPNPDRAYDIINSMLAPETGKYLIEEWGYGHSNAHSFDIADLESVAILGLDQGVEAYLDAGAFGVPQSDEVDTRMARDFETIKTGF